LGAAIHTLYVVLAGIWLGGVVFTTAVVSPALEMTKWSKAERVGVRSVFRKQYARVGSVNLVLRAAYKLGTRAVRIFQTASEGTANVYSRYSRGSGRLLLSNFRAAALHMRVATL
jgi:hypothetical protein